MTDFFYQFARELPWLTFFIALLLLQLVLAPFRLANRFLRHRNIKAHGWPPAHLDADGDFKDED